jgi:S1-C subfamily serine protease
MRLPRLPVPLSTVLVLAITACACIAPQTRAQSVADAFGRVETSVVVIRSVGRMAGAGPGGAAVTVEGIGSGVLISEDGRILTAAHVVQTADEVEVGFITGEVLPARVLGSDAVADVALLQLAAPPPAQAHVASVGDSDRVRTGEEIFVVGAPRGIIHTLSVGHVSARRRGPSPFLETVPVDFFQTDAAINEGNSGGPMFNLAGEVVGVVSYIVTQSGGSEGLGFAVTSNTARELLLDRSAFWSGLGMVSISGDVARALNVPDGRGGLLVQVVAKGSLGEALGLRGGNLPCEILDQTFVLGGDILLAVEGVPVGLENSYDRVRDAMDRLEPGDSIEVEILREGRVLTLKGRIENGR